MQAPDGSRYTELQPPLFIEGRRILPLTVHACVDRGSNQSPVSTVQGCGAVGQELGTPSEEGRVVPVVAPATWLVEAEALALASHALLLPQAFPLTGPVSRPPAGLPAPPGVDEAIP